MYNASFSIKNLYWCEFTCKSGEIKKYIFTKIRLFALKDKKACNFVVLFNTETKITSFEKRIVSW